MLSAGDSRMEWTLRLAGLVINGQFPSFDVMAISRPDGVGDLANLGLTLAESKLLLAQVQRQLVAEQANTHATFRPDCGACGGSCQVKDWQPHRIATLFGEVRLKLPRFLCAGCGCGETGVSWPPRCRSTPELNQLQARLSALMPFRVAADVLQHLLPVDAGTSPETLRSHTLQVGKQLADAAAQKPPAATAAITISLDSTFIRSCEDGERHLEVRVGNVETADGGRQVFGAVAKAETDLTALIQRTLETVGRSDTTELTAFTDGCPGLRTVLANVGVTKPPILDCWGGRPHGIECQTWVVTNQDRSRPCPRLPALVLIRPRLSSPCTASTKVVRRSCEPIFAARRWFPSSRSFLRPRLPWKRAAVPTTGLGNSALSVTTFA